MFSLIFNKKERMLSEMGFYSDQKGILKRYKREKANWDLHLNSTKDFILNSLEGKSRGKIAILGSGWLLDIPIATLAETFSEVVLFDIQHPQEIQKEILKYGNVRTVKCDISGFSEIIYSFAKNKEKHKQIKILLNTPPCFDFDLSTFDMVVSCNILNQLDIILIDFLNEYCNLNKAKEDALREKIQRAHIDILPNGKTCLISDVEELMVNANNEVVTKKKLAYTDLSKFKEEASWIWKFDNFYTYSSQNKTWFRVVGLKN